MRHQEKPTQSTEPPPRRSPFTFSSRVFNPTNGTEDISWINEGQDYPKLWWELDAP